LVLVRILLIKDAYSNGMVEGGDRVFEYYLGHEYVSAVSSLGTGGLNVMSHIQKNIPGCSKSLFAEIIGTFPYVGKGTLGTLCISRDFEKR